MTIREALAEGAAALREAGVAEPRREAAALLMHATGRGRAYLVAHDDERLAEDLAARFRESVARRARGEPTQYVTGRQEFYGREFEVTPDVLIPRPETEHLVEAALDVLRETESPSLCDIGTGSGCIAVTMLAELRGARGVGCDISEAALRVARRNAVRHGVVERLQFLVSDCFAVWDAEADATRPRFDIIVSNPPYISESEMADLQREVREHEPRSALTPGGDGLSVVRRLVADAPRYLRQRGHLIFEIGYNQHEEVARMLDPHVWTLLRIDPDLQGIPRVVVLRRAG